MDGQVVIDLGPDPDLITSTQVNLSDRVVVLRCHGEQSEGFVPIPLHDDPIVMKEPEKEMIFRIGLVPHQPIDETLWIGARDGYTLIDEQFGLQEVVPLLILHSD